jgi:hypothetical protein
MSVNFNLSCTVYKGIVVVYSKEKSTVCVGIKEEEEKKWIKKEKEFDK